MAKIFDRLSEYHGAFFIPPSELRRAAEWCKKHNLKGYHCTTLSNIHARWLREPQKPLSLRDTSMLYCISRRTARKLLDVLAHECGYIVERSRNSYGLDEGFLLVPISNNPVGSGGPDPGLIDTGRVPGQSPGAKEAVMCRTDSGAPQSRGWNSAEQGPASHGATSTTPSRTIKKGFKEEVRQNSEWLAWFQQYQIGTEQEAMLEQALMLWVMRQGMRQGCSSVDACDVQEIVEAFLSIQADLREGEEESSLTWLLAGALDEAESEFWQQGKNVPECAGGFFSKRISLDYHKSKMQQNFSANPLKVSSQNPRLAWDKNNGKWVSRNPRYEGPMPRCALKNDNAMAPDVLDGNIFSQEKLRASIGGMFMMP